MRRCNQKINIIYYENFINETQTNIADSKWNNYIRLSNRKKLMKLKRKIRIDGHRKKIGYILVWGNKFSRNSYYSY